MGFDSPRVEDREDADEPPDLRSSAAVLGPDHGRVQGGPAPAILQVFSGPCDPYSWPCAVSGLVQRPFRPTVIMSRIISLEISNPSRSGERIDGFQHFWAYRVSGFRPDRHCQACFIGTRIAEFIKTTIRIGVTVAVSLRPDDRYLYVCGVGSGPKTELHRKNLHLPLRCEPGATVSRVTYNGYLVTAHNAVELPIPALEPGWGGRDLETTRCKNFQFGVAYFGGTPGV